MAELKIILGVDFGDARTGLAVSDAFGKMAFGAGVLRVQGVKKTAQAVAEEARKRGSSLIVVGNPINMNGSEGPRSEKCRVFCEFVREYSGLPTELYDERLTTVSAHRLLSESGVFGQKRKNAVDELSAQLILQDYLDRKNRDAEETPED
ncbi:MAG: Holliday junction resolvase RuvX [Clostridia bacterium]|nr:Holliday junction resolvase RuvX [Clostridia bacterium]